MVFLMKFVIIIEGWKMKKIILVLSVVFLTGIAWADVYDNFESGVIDSAKWASIGTNWGILDSDTKIAWSYPGAVTGSLVSNEIAVSENGYLTLRVNGHDGSTKDADGFWGAVENHWVEVRGGGADGPVLARINTYENTLRSFKIDARGYSTVTVVGVDNGSDWVGMDDIATTTGTAHQLISNGSFESGLTNWTTTGTAWQALVKAKPYWESTPRFASEGGLFVSTYADESLTGTMTSEAIVVTQDTLTFDAAGYSGGPWGGGNNRFEILDSEFNVIATILGDIGAQGVLQGGTWVEKSFDLLAAGLNYGDTFYFRAIDGDTGSYGWIAFDNVRLTGEVPEPATIALFSFGILYCLKRKK